MLKLNQDQVDVIKKMAQSGMPLHSISKAIDVPIDIFIIAASDENSELSRLITAQEIISDTEFLTKIKASAQIGIPQAQALLFKIKKYTACQNIKTFNRENII